MSAIGQGPGLNAKKEGTALSMMTDISNLHLNGFNTSPPLNQGWARTCMNFAPPILLIGILTVLSWTLATYWIPAHGGVDPNGYLVTARLIADEHSVHFVPEDPHQYVGDMIIQTEDGRMLAKYPPGFPLLAAIARMLTGPTGMYIVNPICIVLACAFAYALFRQLLDPFCSLLATLFLATNPVTLALANTPSSHASTLLCVCIGFWGLLRWLHHRSWSAALIGAFALGYAATTRYSEALLLLPVLFITIATLRRSRQSVIENTGILLLWCIPIMFLALFCWWNFGTPWKTGYSYCAEDTGFALKYFFGDPATNRQSRWETLITQVNWLGLFMLWPLGILGMIIMLGERWQTAICLILWTLPSTLLYLGYYWAPTSETSVGYLRFFLVLQPGLILAALWLLQRATNGMVWTRAIGLGTITMIAVGINLGNILPTMARNYAAAMAIAEVATTGYAHIPKKSAIFTTDDNIANHLDAWGGYQIFDCHLFSTASYDKWKRLVDDPDQENEPEGRQRIRMRQYLDLISQHDAQGRRYPQTKDTLQEAQSEVISKQIAQHRRVFFLIKRGQSHAWLPTSRLWQSKLVQTIPTYPGEFNSIRPIGGWNLIGHGSIRESTRPTPPVVWNLFEITPQ